MAAAGTHCPLRPRRAPRQRPNPRRHGACGVLLQAKQSDRLWEGASKAGMLRSRG
jgi:hypothetical protein